MLVGHKLHLVPKIPRPRRRPKCVCVTPGPARATAFSVVVGSKTTRDNVKDHNDHPSGRHLDQPARPASEAQRRAKFAKDLARSEFGRFYFDERLESLMLQAMRQRRRPGGKDRG